MPYDQQQTWPMLASATVPPGVLEFRMLGELDVLRAGVSLPQPPSKKTRALLAYLVLSGRTHRRDTLCSLLWDVADDPRGALRWSLSKLRKQVDDDTHVRITTDREHVGFEPHGALIDVVEMRAALDGGRHESAPTQELERWCARCNSELLEGMDLPDFDGFQAWLIAEREQTRRLHANALRELTQRHHTQPDTALPYARTWARVDPMSAEARLSLMRLALAGGRPEEAKRQLEVTRRLFAELDPAKEKLIVSEWHAMRSQQPTSTAPTGVAYGSTPPTPPAAPASQPTGATPLRDSEPTAAASRPSVIGRLPLIGRDAEASTLRQALREVGESHRAQILLFTGEPGIGKSRLIDEMRQMCRAGQHPWLDGAAFEGEVARPYGPWIDALRKLPAETFAHDGLQDSLSPLLASAPDSTTRSREALFAGVVSMLRRVCSERPPVVVMIDDVHWLDDGSAELLHYTARSLRDHGALFVLAAREAELHDQGAVVRALRSLRRDLPLREISVPRLPERAIAELAQSVDSSADPGSLYLHSGGNPLFALELARAGVIPEGPSSVADAVRDRLSHLSAEAADVLRWGAVLGTSFDPRQLTTLSSLGAEAQLDALDTLERHALIRNDPDTGYGFSHEIVRRVVYSDLSQPRRVLMHRRVAELLRSQQGTQSATADEALVADLARHAALAEDHALAAEAYVAAGRRCLRFFANDNAFSLARRGLRHARELPDAKRAPLTLDLFEVQLWARRPEDHEAFCVDVQALAELAMQHGHPDHARLGFHMISYVRWERGDWKQARRSVNQVQPMLRAVDGIDRVHALGDAARCLALLERDMGQAEAMAAEASALAKQLGLRSAPLDDAVGLLKMHLGDLDGATQAFESAQQTAHTSAHRYFEVQALFNRFQLYFDEKQHEVALEIALEIAEIAGKIREGSERPYAQTLLTLARIAAGRQPLDATLDADLEALRVVDAKHRLTYALTRAATLLNDLGKHDQACRLAHEGLAVARFLERPSDVALALCALWVAQHALGDVAACEQTATQLTEAASARLSAHALQALNELRQ